MSLLHTIAPGTPESINVIIEINKGSKNKYEIDKETGLIALDRVLYSAQDFPFDYGFVPQSLWLDDDPLDVIVLTTYPLLPGILVRVRPVGLVNMIDSGDADDKIIAVPVDDPRWANIQDLNDINQHQLKEIEHFLSTYKLLQKKEVTISGFKNKAEAIKVFEKGCALYREKQAV